MVLVQVLTTDCRHTGASAVVAAVLTCAAAALAACGLALAIPQWHVLPFWDQWAAVVWYEWIVTGKRTLLEVLAMPHNEHRMIPTQLAFLADLALFHGRTIFPYALLVLSSAALWASIAVLATRGRAGHLRVAAFAIALAALASPLQFDNLTLAFNLQWPICALASLAAFYCTARLAEAPAWRHTIAASAAVAVAVFSSANGLVCAGLVLTGAIMLPIPPRHRVVLSALAALAAALFFVGYRPPGGGSEWRADLWSVAGWREYLGFVATLIGMPGLAAGTTAAMAIGAAACAGFGVTLVALRRSRHIDASEFALIALAAMALITAAMVGLGRAKLGSVFDGAGRYGTFVLLFWMCLAALALRLDRSAIAAWIAVLTLGASFVSGQQFVGVVRLWVSAATAAEVDLRAGRPIAGRIHPIYPDPAELASLVEFLRQRRLSTFAD